MLIGKNKVQDNSERRKVIHMYWGTDYDQRYHRLNDKIESGQETLQEER